METKICAKCGEEKVLSEYHRSKCSTDGHQPRCKDCARVYYQANVEKIALQRQTYRRKNRATVAKGKRKYNKANREKINAYQRKYDQRRRDAGAKFRLRSSLRNRIWRALNGTAKSVGTMELIGCNIEELKEHLEFQFQEGMTWDNYGGWHVDHIKPCASFDLSDIEQQKLCFNYTNLQPLWAEDNWSKNANVAGSVTH